jgi:hypothetical protein
VVLASSAPVTVMLCDVSQLALVKVSWGGDAVATVELMLATETTTLDVGSAESWTMTVPVPVSVTPIDDGGVTIRTCWSSSVIITIAVPSETLPWPSKLTVTGESTASSS